MKVCGSLTCCQTSLNFLRPGWISWTRRASQSRRLRPKSFQPKTQLDSTEVKEIDSTAREEKEKERLLLQNSRSGKLLLQNLYNNEIQIRRKSQLFFSPFGNNTCGSKNKFLFFYSVNFYGCTFFAVRCFVRI